MCNIVLGYNLLIRTRAQSPLKLVSYLFLFGLTPSHILKPN